MATRSEQALARFLDEMRVAKRSPRTIEDRLSVLRRLGEFLDGTALLDADGEQLREFQSAFAPLAPATVDIYSRHVKAFYDWAFQRGLVSPNPAVEMVATQTPKGRPHPSTPDELRVVFACTRGWLRLAYVLAAFVGLRCGEICRLHGRDIDTSLPEATALIHGKATPRDPGGKERIVPLIAPVMLELRGAGVLRGWVVSRAGGAPLSPRHLSAYSSTHLHQLGLATTLHSMRGTFATVAGRTTKDPLFVRDLLGHESVKTTEVYMLSTLDGAHRRLAGVESAAAQLLNGGRLRAVP